MKRATLALLLVCGAVFAQQGKSSVSLDKLELRNGVYYLKNKPYTGKFEQSCGEECSGFSTGSMKDGKFHGEYDYGDESGSIKGNYKDGKKHGYWIEFDESGYFMKVENYKDGEEQEMPEEQQEAIQEAVQKVAQKHQEAQQEATQKYMETIQKKPTAQQEAMQKYHKELQGAEQKYLEALRETIQKQLGTK